MKGGDPKLAREIQNVVNGPIEPIIEELKRMGRTAANLRYLPQERFPLTTPVNQLTSFQNRLLRHELLAHKYGTSFENLLTVGVDDITHLPFAPIAGNQFSAKTATYFTAAQR